MGLDFALERRVWEAPSVDAPRWSYGGFNNFRRSLAALIGIDLDTMAGFGGAGRWKDVSDDIVPFLNHSDCEGYLEPDECEKIAPRLRELCEQLEDEYDRDAGLRLAAMMEEVAAEEDGTLRLLFC